MKFSKKLLLKIFLTICLFSPLTINAQPGIVHCYKQHFECFQGATDAKLKEISQITDTAAGYIGGSSPDTGKKRVYLTKLSLSDKGGLSEAYSGPVFYAQTNFKPDKLHFDKFLITNGFSRIFDEIKKITVESEIDTENITYFVEEKLLLDETFQDFFDTGRFGKKSPVFLIGADKERRPLTYIPHNGQSDWALNDEKIGNLFHSLKKKDLFYLRQRDGQFVPLLKIGYNLFIHPEAVKEFNKYANLPINSDDIRILNLFNDESQKIIKNSFLGRQIEFDLKEAGNRTEQQNLDFLENHFRLHSSTTVFVIAHIDKATGNYLIEDAASNVVFSIPIKKLEEIAANYSVNIIHMGCESALQSTRGTINTVYSTDVAERLSAAVKGKTLKEFFTILASKNPRFESKSLILVIDRNFVEETRIKFEITVFKSRKSDNKNKGGGNDGNGGGNNGGGGGNGGNGGKYEYDEVGKMNISFPRIKPFVPPSPSPTPADESTLPQELSGVFLYLVIGLSGGGFFIFFVLLCKVLHKKFQETVPPPTPEDMIEVKCPFCGQKNNVVKERAASAVCGNRRCRKPMF